MFRPPASFVRVLLLLLVYGAVVSCRPARRDAPPLILISADGLRYDFLDRVPTPAIDALARHGVRAPLVPVFPTKTFPNHYTIVTGLYPAQHGIVANNIYDPVLDARFSLSDRDAVGDGRWWGGEPIWVTVERQGRPAATYFWPGSEAPIDGVRPTWWSPYDPGVSYDERIDRVLAWLDLPASERPVFIATYLEEVDAVGHEFGPDAPQVDSAVARVDRAIGRLLDGLSSRGLRDRVNVILVSDHGLADTSRDRVIFIDDYLTLDAVEVVDWSPVLQIRPTPGAEAAIYDALAGRHPHLQVYRRADIPERFRYRDSRRIQPIVAIADPGWEIGTRAVFDRVTTLYRGGNHGYDPEDPSMLSVFVAGGPGFADGVVGQPFQSIHVYALMSHLLGVTPAANEGSLDSTAVLLRENGAQVGE